MYTEPGIYQDTQEGLLYCYNSSDDYTAIKLDNSDIAFTFVRGSIRYSRIILLHASPTLTHAQEHFPEFFI
jgi:hypothetical protein